jgi:hypothetical protein
MTQRLLPLLACLLLVGCIGADEAAAQAPVIPAPLIDGSALAEAPAPLPVGSVSWTGQGARTGFEAGPGPLALSEAERRRSGITGLMVGGAVGLMTGAFLCGFARGMVGGSESRELGCALAFGAGGAALGGIVGASMDLVR